MGDPSAERHQALGILLDVRPGEERCSPGRRIAAGGTGDHLLPFTTGLSGADGAGGLRRGPWGDAHGSQAHGRLSQKWWAPEGARCRYSSALLSSSATTLSRNGSIPCGALPRILVCFPCMVTSRPS